MIRIIQFLFDILMRIYILLKWPIAIVMITLGLFFCYLPIGQTVLCSPQDQTSSQYEIGSPFTFASKTWIPNTPQDGGPAFLLPKLAHKTTGRKNTCVESYDLQFIISNLMATLLGISFFLLAYSTVQLPKISRLSRKLTLFATGTIILTTQMFPWIAKAAAPPVELMILYHTLTGGLLIWLCFILRKSLQRSKVVVWN